MSLRINRRGFLKSMGIGTISAFFPAAFLRWCAAQASAKPNIILCMADDLGWGDTGYNGNEIIQTPHLDEMSKSGIRFDRFYAGAPVCSPTRGSALTGRHPYRYGVFKANVGHLKDEEICLAEVLKQAGYVTGHFGKWHLGTLTPEFSGKGPGRKPRENYMTPGMQGFDEWFSTEYAVPTWDPYQNRRDPRTLYWHNGKNIRGGLEGDDSRIIMDKAVPFIRKAVAEKTPFFAVIWFHAPHGPVIAGEEYRRRYVQYPENEQHYYGVVTAMDDQVGRLRKTLRALGVAENTMLWFCSDNGPEGNPEKRARHQGSAGPFRGRKRSLYEGGVRVPGVLEWPAKIREPRVEDFPCVTSDYFPTIVELLGYQIPGEPRPYDGISLMSVIEGTIEKRPRPIGFQFPRFGQASVTDHRYKLVYNETLQRNQADNGTVPVAHYELYDLIEDPGEIRNIAEKHPEEVKRLRSWLEEWQKSCEASLQGNDY